MLEKTLKSPLDCKEIQPVHSEGPELRAVRAVGPPCPLPFHLDQGAHHCGRGKQASLSGPSTQPLTSHPLPAPPRHWLFLGRLQGEFSLGAEPGEGAQPRGKAGDRAQPGAKPGDGAQPGPKPGDGAQPEGKARRQGSARGQSWERGLSSGVVPYGSLYSVAPGDICPSTAVKDPRPQPASPCLFKNTTASPSTLPHLPSFYRETEAQRCTQLVSSQTALCFGRLERCM